MRRRITYGVILLAVLVLVPATAAAQDPGSDATPRTIESGFELQQNFPNPFNTTTRIPFVLDHSLVEEGQVAVTMRIFNVLQQLVAYPTALDHPEGEGIRVEALNYYTAGEKAAFWDGRDLDGRQVTSGMYYLQMVVNGQRQIIKMMFR